MKLLIVCQYFYPERFRVNDICFELVKQGHEVTVLTGLPNYPFGTIPSDYKKIRYEEIEGVKVYRSWLLGRGQSNKKLLLNYITFAISASIKAIGIKGDYDKVLVYQLSPVTMILPGVILKKKKKIPLIIYAHDLWPESLVSGGIEKKSLIYRIVKFVSSRLYNQADEMWYSSEMFHKYFNEYLNIEKPNKYLPSYAESLFENISHNEDVSNINLVFAGNIGEMQSVETIIKAASLLKQNDNIKFHIVGDGSAKERCETLAFKLGLENVFFYGSKPIEEMPYYYSLADAFLITLKDNEIISYTLPNKVQSYLAAGKPIIASVFGETKSVIEKADCGYVSYPNNHELLARNIFDFTNQSLEKQKKLGENAKRFYKENFAKESFFIRLNNYLSSYK